MQKSEMRRKWHFLMPSVTLIKKLIFTLDGRYLCELFFYERVLEFMTMSKLLFDVMFLM